MLPPLSLTTFCIVQPGMTSLHLAMAYACPAIVAALLDRGADSRAVSANGCSPLFGAACFGRTENVLLWYARFPGYKIRREYDIGAVPLDGADGGKTDSSTWRSYSGSSIRPSRV